MPPMTRTFVAAVLAGTVALAAHAAFASAPAATTEDPLHARYRDAAGRIIGAALVSDRAYQTLGELCDRFGHRLSGSSRLEAAIDWAGERMRADGFANVREEPAMVPRWVRGRESARLVAPAEHDLSILGLGDSVGTPPEGLEADVVVVGGFDELEALGEDKVRGRIVLYDVPFTEYGKTVVHRSQGPSRAARLGAVAVLVRSVGPISYDTPHTGATSYAEDAPRIPAAAVTIENATMMRRIAERGDLPRVRLEMEARTEEDAPSANVVAEVVGSERPEEVVVIGGHIDTWDVGQGAQDDGAGCVIAWEAARLIHQLGLRPRRTIRVVLFTNEENGTRGAKAYARAHAAELHGHVAMIESDSGNGLARGFHLELKRPKTDSDAPADKPTMAKWDESRAKEKAKERAKQAGETPPAEEPDAEVEALVAKALAVLGEIAPLLEPLGATAMAKGGSGADLGPSVERGVPGLGLHHDTSEYFHIHHTRADTFDKVRKVDLDRNVAAMAVMAYVLADMPGRLVPQGALAPRKNQRSKPGE